MLRDRHSSRFNPAAAPLWAFLKSQIAGFGWREQEIGAAPQREC
jgi:hypothetical protein